MSKYGILHFINEIARQVILYVPIAERLIKPLCCVIQTQLF